MADERDDFGPIWPEVTGQDRCGRDNIVDLFDRA